MLCRRLVAGIACTWNKQFTSLVCVRRKLEDNQNEAPLARHVSKVMKRTRRIKRGRNEADGREMTLVINNTRPL